MIWLPDRLPRQPPTRPHNADHVRIGVRKPSACILRKAPQHSTPNPARVTRRFSPGTFASAAADTSTTTRTTPKADNAIRAALPRPRRSPHPAAAAAHRRTNPEPIDVAADQFAVYGEVRCIARTKVPVACVAGTARSVLCRSRALRWLSHDSPPCHGASRCAPARLGRSPRSIGTQASRVLPTAVRRAVERDRDMPLGGQTHLLTMVVDTVNFAGAYYSLEDSRCDG